MNNSKTTSRQKGAAMPEFAFAAIWFFVVLLMAFEVGRWMFIMNTLTEATRRGARVAAVCPPYNAFIKKAAVFGDINTGTTSPILPGLTTSMVNIAYFCREDSDGVNGPDPVSPPAICSGLQAQPFFVEVSINNYSGRLIVPVIGGQLTLGKTATDKTATRLPIESYDGGGYQTAAAGNQCF